MDLIMGGNVQPSFDIPNDQMGWVDEDALRALLEKYPGGIGVEVGAWLGRVSYKMMRAGFSKVYAVDTFEGEGSFLNDWKGKNKFDVLGTYMINLRDYLDKVNILQGDSRRMWEYIKEPVDFVFIDGDHRYSRVSEDIKNYYPLVKKGGIFAGHDLDQVSWDERYIEEDYVEGNHHGVAKAVGERFGEVKRNGRVWWVDVN